MIPPNGKCTNKGKNAKDMATNTTKPLNLMAAPAHAEVMILCNSEAQTGIKGCHDPLAITQQM
jgi:hypothetical protein